MAFREAFGFVKVYMETMGCQMNRLDSELVAGRLRAAGHELIADRKAAQVVLYNTCSVRQHAEQKVYSRLGAEGQRKSHHRPNLVVGVLGCMAQREGEQLLKKYPQVDIICAPGRLSELAEAIEVAAAGQAQVLLDPQRSRERDTAAEQAADRMDLAREPFGDGIAQAYVRVVRGCDKFCSYCIVPFVRGRQRSRNPDDIVQEVRRLIDAGRSEITLLGQTVNGYLWQAGETTVRFSDLLEKVSAVASLRRLKFVTSHPLNFGDDILYAMRDLPNVCRYIHCPAQSGSDAVLKRMNRRYTRREYDELVDRARAIVPDVVLAGDFIVGFPGETEQDHEASADLIRRSGYKNSFIFKYSPRPGTAAAKQLKDDVPQDVKKRRNNELLAVQAEVGLAHHQALVGKTVEVLVEGPSPRVDKQAQKPTADSAQLTGRTSADHIVVFDGARHLAGKYVDVTITAATPLTLLGELGG
ncbi:MAG: tRNA (N6-isopentenyl adenosine(37)-C2)-methylthiotransferase MiaB [Planctomycetota bacterium]|nr:tRNA (N6-isopentenyl adenosine(37)-C2)-methylthiotransferase MiaB [Planctomycetota bacterium]